MRVLSIATTVLLGLSSLTTALPIVADNNGAVDVNAAPLQARQLFGMAGKALANGIKKEHVVGSDGRLLEASKFKFKRPDGSAFLQKFKAGAPAPGAGWKFKYFQDDVENISRKKVGNKWRKLNG